MTPDGHYFRNGGPCVFCGATSEKVRDRRAPPFCAERPEESITAPPKRGNETTGY